MTTKTRYFVITSLLILVVGLGTGLLAYYVGLPGGGLLGGHDGAEELRYLPPNTTIVAYADVGEIMASNVRQKLRQAMPGHEDGQRQFEEQTGIAIESDIDHIVASLQPAANGQTAGLVLARGRFSDVKIEALMREHGAIVDEYGGRRVIALPAGEHAGQGRQHGPVALAFLEPGLVAVGSAEAIHVAIDLQKSGANVTGNQELMDLMRSLDRGNAWAIGRLDALVAARQLPGLLTARLPPISWFSISGRVDSDISGTVRADTRDEEAANNLRDVVRGFLALAKLQTGSRPELQTLVDSLDLSGTGKSVALSFTVPGAALDAIGARMKSSRQR